MAKGRVTSPMPSRRSFASGLASLKALTRLEISGKRTLQAEKETESHYTEMPEKDYYRAFTIGEEIDREKISAQLNNGVLKVVLPKAERAKPKKIDIKYS